MSRVTQALARIEAGKLVEAMMLADEAPPLLAQCRDLAFEGAEAWRELCMQRGWPMANPVDLKAVDRLAAAMEAGRQPAALLKEYRAAARQKDLRSCIWLLRQLKRAEPGNGAHERDLKEFEIRRMEDLRREFQGASARSDEASVRRLAGEIVSPDWSIPVPIDLRMEDMRKEFQGASARFDEASVRRLAGEIVSPDWSIPVPIDLRSAVEAALAGLDAKRALEEAKVLLDKLAAAYSAMDVDAGIPLVGRIEALLKAAGIELPTDLARQFSDARDWCRQEEKRRDDEAHFARKVSELTAAVERGDAVAADSTLNELARHDRPLPDTLGERAEGLVGAWQLARERARRRMNVAIVVGLMLAAGVALFIWREVQVRSRAAMLVRELNDMFGKLDLEAYGRRISRAKAEEPGLLAHPEVAPLIGRTNEMARLIGERRTKFEALVARLGEEVASEKPGDDVDAVFQEAEKLAREGEDVARLADLASSWAKRKADRRGAIQDAWDAWTVEMNRRLGAMDAAQSGGDATAVSNAISGAREALSKAPELPDAADSKIVGQFSERISRVEGLGKEAGEQLARIRTAASLPAYLDAMDVFAKAFDRDVRVPAIRKVLELRQPLEALLETPAASASNPYWNRAKARQSALAADSTKWTTIRDQILEMEEDDRLVSLFEFQTVPLPGTTNVFFIQGQPGAGADGRSQVMSYAVANGARDKEPNFVMQPWNPLYTPRLVRMPHCAVIDKLIAELRFGKPENGLEILLQQTDAWLSREDVPSILRAGVGAELLAAMKEIAPASSAESLESARLSLEVVGDSIHWLCRGHPQYAVASKTASEAVASARMAVGSLLRNREWKPVDTAALLRSPQWVACAGLDGPGIEMKGKAAGRELWVVRLIDGKPRILILADPGADGTTRQRLQLEPGEPIFAPMDGFLTRDILTNLRKGGNKLATTEILADPAWPANCAD
jgi:hypothetical protein